MIAVKHTEPVRVQGFSLGISHNNKIEEMANHYGMNKSEFMRELIDGYYKKDFKKAAAHA